MRRALEGVGVLALCLLLFALALVLAVGFNVR